MSETTAAPAGRKAQAEATRKRLLDAAVIAFTTRPFDEVAVGEIADAAGSAHGLPFHYFGNKRGLYLAALHEAAEHLFAAQQVAESGPPRARIKTMLFNHFTFMRKHEALAMALFRGGIGADPAAWEIFEASRQRSLSWICTVLGLDSERRALRIMLRAVTGAIDEATIQWMQQRSTLELSSLLDALLDLLASSISGAQRLDPELDVRAALVLLSSDGA